MWARIGDYNIRSGQDEKERKAQSVTIDIEKCINHPHYDKKTHYNDIALVKLKEKVEFNDFVRPICLHTESTISEKYGTITGWGDTKHGKYSTGLSTVEKVSKSSTGFSTVNIVETQGG